MDGLGHGLGSTEPVGAETELAVPSSGWIILAIVIAVLFGLSLVVEALLWIAIVAAAIWAVAFVLRGMKRSLA